MALISPLMPVPQLGKKTREDDFIQKAVSVARQLTAFLAQ